MPEFAECAEQVAESFGLGRVVAPMREVARGEQARIWRLDTEAGRFAVKQPLRGIEPRTDGIDVAFQETVLAGTDVVMPLPVRRPDGSFLASVDGQQVRVSTWVDMCTADPGLDPRRVGTLLATLHRVEFESPGEVHPWYWAPVGAESWQLIGDRLEAGAAPFAGRFRAAVPGLVLLEGLLEAPGQTRICHCDLWADNLLATPDGELCVIDWDNCGPADPSHELTMLMYEFGSPSADRTRALYDAYVAAGGPGRLTRAGQLTMVIAQLGHFWEMAAEAWLDPAATAQERRHAEDRVAELLSRPLTVQTVDAIVSAVG